MTLTDEHTRQHLGSDEAQIVRDSTGLYLWAGKQRATWMLRQTENGKTQKSKLGNRRLLFLYFVFFRF